MPVYSHINGAAERMMKSCTEAPHSEDAQRLEEIYNDGMLSSFAMGNVARANTEHQIWMMEPMGKPVSW